MLERGQVNFFIYNVWYLLLMGVHGLVRPQMIKRFMVDGNAFPLNESVYSHGLFLWEVSWFRAEYFAITVHFSLRRGPPQAVDMLICLLVSTDLNVSVYKASLQISATDALLITRG